ncbi:hypothetical protein [Mycolicibacterium pulveris]|uniref:hypothetical protein n=1 Tax=Mycolicibacterium pulveris TaxID=36813 RepID=UPI003CEDB0C8
MWLHIRDDAEPIGEDGIMKVKHLSAAVFGAAALALAVGVAQPAVSYALWDIGEYDKCVKAGKVSDLLCCVSSGGDWDINKRKCTAPMTAQTPPQSPGEVVQAPSSGTATQAQDAPQAPPSPRPTVVATYAPAFPG